MMKSVATANIPCMKISNVKTATNAQHEKFFYLIHMASFEDVNEQIFELICFWTFISLTSRFEIFRIAKHNMMTVKCCYFFVAKFSCVEQRKLKIILIIIFVQSNRHLLKLP